MPKSSPPTSEPSPNADLLSITVNAKTGQIVKVESLDDAGVRRDLSDEKKADLERRGERDDDDMDEEEEESGGSEDHRLARLLIGGSIARRRRLRRLLLARLLQERRGEEDDDDNDEEESGGSEDHRLARLLIGGSFPRSFLIPGTDTSLRIGGFANGSALWYIKGCVTRGPARQPRRQRQYSISGQRPASPTLIE
jgi:hypothetical protein